MIATAYKLSGMDTPMPITSDAQNEQYISELLEMERRGGLSSTEKNYMEVLTLLIETYEEKRYPIRKATQKEVLVELMSANDLKQKDLGPDLGGESVVSAIIRGPRKLNVGQIERLSKRFKVSPAVFF